MSQKGMAMCTITVCDCCSGSGSCDPCDGYGVLPDSYPNAGDGLECEVCSGEGLCPQCAGSGECDDQSDNGDNDNDETEDNDDVRVSA